MGTGNESWISQIRKGTMELAILALLKSGEMYGTEIVTTLSGKPSLAVTAGTIYPLLSRMKRTGLIDSVWRESPVGPPRKYYSLTPSGLTELEEMSKAWDSVSQSIEEIISGKVTR